MIDLYFCSNKILSMNTKVFYTPVVSGREPEECLNLNMKIWESVVGFNYKFFRCCACDISYTPKHFVAVKVEKVGESSGNQFIVPICENCSHKECSFSVDDSLLVPFHDKSL